MRLIQKFFARKKEVEQYIIENGMEKAIQEYGIGKICMFKMLKNYIGTELYHDDFSFEDKVYDKNGKFLGVVTDLMCPLYKSAGSLVGPCVNGNIILSEVDEELNFKSLTVFDKFGNQLVPYGKYYKYCFLPNGVALINDYEKTTIPVTTISYDGVIEEKDYTHIKECFIDKTVGTDVRSYKIYRNKGNQVQRSVIHLDKNGLEVDLDEKIEKGIE